MSCTPPPPAPASPGVTVADMLARQGGAGPFRQPLQPGAPGGAALLRGAQCAGRPAPHGRGTTLAGEVTARARRCRGEFRGRGGGGERVLAARGCMSGGTRQRGCAGEEGGLLRSRSCCTGKRSLTQRLRHHSSRKRCGCMHGTTRRCQVFDPDHCLCWVCMPAAWSHAALGHPISPPRDGWLCLATWWGIRLGCRGALGCRRNTPR